LIGFGVIVSGLSSRLVCEESTHASPALNSVLAKVELLGGFQAERVLHEPLAAGVAEIKTHRTRQVFGHARVFAVVKAFEQVFHLFEVISFLVETIEGLASTEVVLHRWKHLDPDDVPNVDLGMNRSFADITRIMKHRVLPGKNVRADHRCCVAPRDSLFVSVT
jgi:hypothetical protein